MHSIMQNLVNVERKHLGSNHIEIRNQTYGPKISHYKYLNFFLGTTAIEVASVLLLMTSLLWNSKKTFIKSSWSEEVLESWWSFINIIMKKAVICCVLVFKGFKMMDQWLLQTDVSSSMPLSSTVNPSENHLFCPINSMQRNIRVYKNTGLSLQLLNFY